MKRSVPKQGIAGVLLLLYINKQICIVNLDWLAFRLSAPNSDKSRVAREGCIVSGEPVAVTSCDIILSSVAYFFHCATRNVSAETVGCPRDE